MPEMRMQHGGGGALTGTGTGTNQRSKTPGVGVHFLPGDIFPQSWHLGKIEL
jgi:hypothetical protein